MCDNQIKGDSFPYEHLKQFTNCKRFRLFIQGYNKILLKDANMWDSFTNSQWVVRIYTASKLILSSNLLLENVIYGRRKNIRISEPYLLYYALLCCCRGVVLTSALQTYDKIFPEKELTHEKTINISIDILKKFNKQNGEEWGDVIKKARMQREIFSYNFPSSGLSIFGSKIIKLEEVIDICRVLSEIAQLQSSIVQRFVEKRNLQTVLNTTPIYERGIYGDEKNRMRIMKT